MKKCSVVMSVYNGEKSEFLKASLESVFCQTVMPGEVVLVCDGNLKSSLNSVIDEFLGRYPEIFRVIKSEKLGTAEAANLGIKSAKHEIIIKTDSDDINYPNRIAEQLKAFEQNPELDICSAQIREFDSKTGEEIAVKSVPLLHDDIIKFSKRRNPFNNPVLAYKKSKALEIGGYSDLKRCEDYDFVMRMLMSGAKAGNIDEILLDYRVNADNIKRRKNWNNTKSFISVRYSFYRKKYCSFWDFVVPSLAQLVMFVLPNGFTEFIYRKLLRKQQ